MEGISDDLLVEDDLDELLYNRENLIFLCYRGSISHGLYNSPESGGVDDIDLFSVFVAPIEHYLGFPKNRLEKGHDRFTDQYDCVSYELRHFLALAADINPNILGPLWMPDRYVIETTRFMEELRYAKEAFRSKKRIFDAYRGYAQGQYEKMQKDRCNLEEIQRLEELQEAKEAGILQKEDEDEYENLRQKYYSGHMGRKRKKMVLEHGYDPKHAEHTIRLLRTGIEFLETGYLHVDRSQKGDAEELLAIKNGEWSYEKVCEEIKRLEERMELAYEQSSLPETVDHDRVEELLIDTVREFHEV